MGCCSSNGILIDEIKKNDRSHQKNSSKKNQMALRLQAMRIIYIKIKYF